MREKEKECERNGCVLRRVWEGVRGSEGRVCGRGRERACSDDL